jgi:hypothetical protein
MVPTIVKKILTIFKRKRLNRASRLERIPSYRFKNNSLRNREVYSQSKDLLKWKIKSRKYGNSTRIAKETVFSSRERISAIKYKNMMKEMILKVSLCNLFKQMA